VEAGASCTVCSEADCLAPIALEPSRKKVREKATIRRASNKGCLSMTPDQYLRLLDWTDRQIRKDKTGRIPDECVPILERLECNAETWLDFVKNFRKRFRNEAGLLKNRQHFRFTRRQARSTSGVSSTGSVRSSRAGICGIGLGCRFMVGGTQDPLHTRPFV